jgi:hypothetical protein
MEWLYKEEVINKSEYHLMIELIEDTFKNNWFNPSNRSLIPQ